MIRRTPIRKVSTRRAAQLRVYSKKRIEFLFTHRRCEVCGNSGATDIHHKQGRVGEMLNREEHWLALCRPCHHHIHHNPKWARETGYLK